MALPAAITVVVAHLLAVIQTWPCIAFPCQGHSLIIFSFLYFSVSRSKMTACRILITSRSAACIIPQTLWDLVKNDNSI